MTTWAYPEEIIGNALRCGASLPDLDQYESLSAPQALDRCGIAIGGRDLLFCPKDFSGKVDLKVRSLAGAANVVILGKDSQTVRSSVNIKGSNNVLVIGEAALLRGVSANIGNGGYCVFGREVTTNTGNYFIVKGGVGIVVGDDCMFAADTMIRTSDSHGIFDKNTKAAINTPEGVFLQAHVWIGDNVKVLKGTQIGVHAVLGGSAVVTKPVPPYCIAAGIPAKIVKRDVLWSRSVLWRDEPMYEELAARFHEHFGTD